MDAHDDRSMGTRLIAPVVAVVIAVGAIVAGVAAHRSSSEQERELLTERTGELAALLVVSTGESRATLLVAGNSMAVPGGEKAFVSATAAATIGGTTTVGVVRKRSGAYAVLGAAGAQAQAKGSTAHSALAPVLDRAQDEQGMVTGIVDLDGAKHAVLALAVPVDRSYVAYLDARLQPTRPVPTQEDSPYRELNVALYAGPKAAADDLVFISGEDPGTGDDVVAKTFQVGVDTWSVTVSARSPLIGTQARAFPWLLGGGGLLTAVILGLMIEVLVRRRRYAMRLVDERTKLLQEAQAAAERANQAREEFFASVSHDIRAPLTAIMGFTELLPVAGPEEQDEFVQRVRSNVTTLGVMVDNMLDHARLNAGALEVKTEPLCLNDFVEQCLRDLGPVLRSHRIDVRGEQVTVLADRLAFGRVLANILVNAVRYSPAGTSIQIEIGSDSLWGKVVIADQGRGIDADDLESIFEEFTRGSRARADGGSGLGLFSVHRLVDAQNGSVGIASKPGEGTTVTIELPLAEDAH